MKNFNINNVKVIINNSDKLERIGSINIDDFSNNFDFLKDIIKDVECEELYIYVDNENDADIDELNDIEIIINKYEFLERLEEDEYFENNFTNELVELLNDLDGEENRIIDTLNKDGRDLKEISDIINNGNIFHISDEWFETSENFKIDIYNELVSQGMEEIDEEGLLLDYLEETEEEDECGFEFERIIRDAKIKEVESFLMFDVEVLHIECGLMVLHTY